MNKFEELMRMMMNKFKEFKELEEIRTWDLPQSSVGGQLSRHSVGIKVVVDGCQNRLHIPETRR